MRIPSSSSQTLKCKEPQLHRITGSFGFKEFEGTAEESAYWNRAGEEKKQELKKKHVATGLCLLCLIDEIVKSTEPRNIVIETEQKRTRQEINRAPSKKIVGGIINRSRELAQAASPNLKVSWEWYKEEAGIVGWTMQNVGAQQTSGILFRNSYYFGNAYWPIYGNNPGFGVTIAADLEPLSDKSIQNNAAPLGIVSWKQADGSHKSIIAFVFTLSPGQTWQMLETGFSHLKPPQNIAIFEVSRVSAERFTLTYDQGQVDAWNALTGNSDKGYAPNPNMFDIVQVLAPPEAPFEQLFERDSIHSGNLSATAPEEEKLTTEDEGEEEEQIPQQEEAPIELEAQPTKGNGTKSLWGLLGKPSPSGKST